MYLYVKRTFPFPFVLFAEFNKCLLHSYALYDIDIIEDKPNEALFYCKTRLDKNKDLAAVCTVIGGMHVVMHNPSTISLSFFNIIFIYNWP